MSKAEVADYFVVSTRTVSRLMRQQPDPLPHTYVGRLPRFEREAVQAWRRRQDGAAAKLPEIVRNAFAAARSQTA
jgi:excisionase family DNA binding protein